MGPGIRLAYWMASLPMWCPFPEMEALCTHWRVSYLFETVILLERDWYSIRRCGSTRQPSPPPTTNFTSGHLAGGQRRSQTPIFPYSIQQLMESITIDRSYRCSIEFHTNSTATPSPASRWLYTAESSRVEAANRMLTFFQG
ncbi:hypothetical protein N656DRAFT_557024 [Canariomyces notabilis]|uniref:Uncharacterized protein n=1 Tax=Canariomyces notabilis TaxID=2074819 RepID=A0AAN6TI55_9PEZI|nr:hypothetical protein N656DRAFT_557024 [Canariomyces arenarius]